MALRWPVGNLAEWLFCDLRIRIAAQTGMSDAGRQLCPGGVQQIPTPRAVSCATRIIGAQSAGVSPWCPMPVGRRQTTDRAGAPAELI